MRNARVAFGFPDMLLLPDDAIGQVADHQAAPGADICLGLFPAPVPEDDEMIELEGTRPGRIVFPPRETLLVYTWNVAVWTPRFTGFLHYHLDAVEADALHTGVLPVDHSYLLRKGGTPGSRSPQGKP